MKEKNRIENQKIIDQAINMSIISKLFKKELITEKQYYILKQKIKTF